jgi:hypothetical protein
MCEMTNRIVPLGHFEQEAIVRWNAAINHKWEAQDTRTQGRSFMQKSNCTFGSFRSRSNREVECSNQSQMGRTRYSYPRSFLDAKDSLLSSTKRSGSCVRTIRTPLPGLKA